MIARTLVTLLLLACTPSLLGADGFEGYSYPLFDGNTLAGWRVVGCEAKVESGAILLAEGDGVVATDHRYGNFILEVDWKALGSEMWDSGIFFRCEMPPPEGRPWPRDYQVNLRKDMEGNVPGLAGATSSGLVKPGDWNHFRLTVLGATASLEINGQPAWKADGVERPSGYIALQSEVPGGGRFLFRNLRITEIGYRPLFNGADLTGWTGATAPAESCWKVEDGLLVCTGEKGTWLRHNDPVGDFNLRLEYRLKPGGNSGVYVRVPAEGSHHGNGSGIEVQILDDNHPRYTELQPYQYSGSVYKIVPADPRVSRPAGEWNTLEINCQGPDYRVTHNGAVVVDAKGADIAELLARCQEGFLGLQNHNEEVWFRHLRIGPPQP